MQYKKVQEAINYPQEIRRKLQIDASQDPAFIQFYGELYGIQIQIRAGVFDELS